MNFRGYPLYNPDLYREEGTRDSKFQSLALIADAFDRCVPSIDAIKKKTLLLPFLGALPHHQRRLLLTVCAEELRRKLLHFVNRTEADEEQHDALLPLPPPANLGLLLFYEFDNVNPVHKGRCRIFQRLIQILRSDSRHDELLFGADDADDDRRHFDRRHAVFGHAVHQDEVIEVGDGITDMYPRQFDPRHFDPRHMDPRHMDPRHMDPRHFDPRHMDPRHMDPRHMDLRHVDPRDFPKTDFLLELSVVLPINLKHPCSWQLLQRHSALKSRMREVREHNALSMSRVPRPDASQLAKFSAELQQRTLELATITSGSLTHEIQKLKAVLCRDCNPVAAFAPSPPPFSRLLSNMATRSYAMRFFSTIVCSQERSSIFPLASANDALFAFVGHLNGVAQMHEVVSAPEAQEILPRFLSWYSKHALLEHCCPAQSDVDAFLLEATCVLFALLMHA